MNKYEIKLSKNRVTYKETLVVAKGVGWWERDQLGVWG